MQLGIHRGWNKDYEDATGACNIAVDDICSYLYGNNSEGQRLDYLLDLSDDPVALAERLART